MRLVRKIGSKKKKKRGELYQNLDVFHNISVKKQDIAANITVIKEVEGEKKGIRTSECDIEKEK
jgi:hypothetical protein